MALNDGREGERERERKLAYWRTMKYTAIIH